ncbi:hypothetical protein [Nostoc sphaeroides]|uniref:Uncharacterized protein n=1 Tax=Nostoc sphaeroides CCNUC1 TaxID=2653204 RepID=A0A5P8WBZ5_9NOSO|nr:hypothetical protein [Nostoc sphaeroides]MCC5632211.1 hypothetical protein [Nostoc sphaeroides CHAB 2801]QFS50144.1 hypothetical protein GXM_07638 [Nostoc sphaeroides CCNUC1]
MKPNKALKMLGFVPQPNLPQSAFLGLTEQYWDNGLTCGDGEKLPHARKLGISISTLAVCLFYKADICVFAVIFKANM